MRAVWSRYNVSDKRDWAHYFAYSAFTLSPPPPPSQRKAMLVYRRHKPNQLNVDRFHICNAAPHLFAVSVVTKSFFTQYLLEFHLYSSLNAIMAYVKTDKTKCAYNCVSILMFWNCFGITDLNRILLFVVAACSCYSFELNCNIISKWAVFEFCYYYIQWTI
jgi:hypothetical protein